MSRTKHKIFWHPFENVEHDEVLRVIALRSLRTMFLVWAAIQGSVGLVLLFTPYRLVGASLAGAVVLVMTALHVKLYKHGIYRSAAEREPVRYYTYFHHLVMTLVSSAVTPPMVYALDHAIGGEFASQYSLTEFWLYGGLCLSLVGLLFFPMERKFFDWLNNTPKRS